MAEKLQAMAWVGSEGVDRVAAFPTEDDRVHEEEPEQHKHRQHGNPDAEPPALLARVPHRLALFQVVDLALDPLARERVERLFIVRLAAEDRGHAKGW